MILTFSAKINKPIHPILYLSGTPLEEVLHHTHLGITFSHDLSWTHHIKSVVKKASQRISIMKRLKNTLSRSTLEKVYIMLIRPILEYGCVMFDACSMSDCKLLETVQYAAATQKTPVTFFSHVPNLLLIATTFYQRSINQFNALTMYYMFKCLQPGLSLNYFCVVLCILVMMTMLLYLMLCRLLFTKQNDFYK